MPAISPPACLALPPFPLLPDTDEKTVRRWFEAYGPVMSVKVGARGGHGPRSLL